MAAGFSLVELMISIVIVALLAVIAVPFYSDYRGQARDATAHADAKTLLTQVTAAAKD